MVGGRRLAAGAGVWGLAPTMYVYVIVFKFCFFKFCFLSFGINPNMILNSF